MSKTERETREALIARWFELTRDILPSMSRHHRWPISLDHCFMRVCLDAVCGSPWHASVARPAIRHLTAAQLAAAIEVAESLVAEPERLDDLNASSLRGRRRAAQDPTVKPSGMILSDTGSGESARRA